MTGYKAADEVRDELDEYVACALRDPSFRAAHDAAQHWETHHPLPLAIGGGEYRRRQRRRVRRTDR